MLTNLVFPTADLIACASRELGFRKSCYPKWAKVTRIEDLPDGKQREIQMMAAIGERLKSLNEAALDLDKQNQTLQSALESATDTNRVLAQRLQLVADHLPEIIATLAAAEAEADVDGPNDGYEALYNEAGATGARLRGLLRELNGGKEPAQC